MKVCLPVEGHKTGKGKFAQRLTPFLEALGCEVTQKKSEKVDIDLQFGRQRYKPRNAKKSIVRLGPAHVSTDQDYARLNKVKWAGIKRTDGIVYQSHYSKKVCHKFIGRPSGKEAIIFNGADPEWYDSLEPHETEAKVNFVAATRKWLPQKRLKEIVKAFALAEIPESKLWIAGETFGYTTAPKGANIAYLGLIDDETLGRLYKMATALVHMVYLDACPNVVVEALCAGCPVICGSAGGTRELVEPSGGTIIVGDTYKYKLTNLGEPPRMNRAALAHAMRIHAVETRKPVNAHVDIRLIAEQYVEFFEAVLK
jgi:glycosyltransferase involved in cell wall biosynthesis